MKRELLRLLPRWVQGRTASMSYHISRKHYMTTRNEFSGITRMEINGSKIACTGYGVVVIVKEPQYKYQEEAAAIIKDFCKRNGTPYIFLRNPGKLDSCIRDIHEDKMAAIRRNDWTAYYRHHDRLMLLKDCHGMSVEDFSKNKPYTYKQTLVV